MDEVENVLVDYVEREVLSECVLDEVLAEIREHIEAQLPQRDSAVAALEAELREVTIEQKRLAKVVALADDVPEPVSELRQRSARIQHLEAQIVATKQTPAELKKLVNQIGTNARAKLPSLRAALGFSVHVRRQQLPQLTSQAPTYGGALAVPDSRERTQGRALDLDSSDDCA